MGVGITQGLWALGALEGFLVDMAGGGGFHNSEFSIVLISIQVLNYT